MLWANSEITPKYQAFCTQLTDNFMPLASAARTYYADLCVREQIDNNLIIAIYAAVEIAQTVDLPGNYVVKAKCCPG